MQGLFFIGVLKLQNGFKAPWSEVRREMTEEKGLAPEVADAIGDFVNQSGLRDVLDRLRANPALAANKSAQEGLDDMETLFTYLEAFDVLDKVSFDLSLARGLDYYTGIIYEVVTEGSAAASPPTEPKIHRAKRRKAAAAASAPAPASASAPVAAADAPESSEAGSGTTTNTEGTTVPATSGKSNSKRQEARDDENDDNDEDDDDRSADPTVGVGSIAAGGRYDDLVGMFSGKTQIPCVGISFGIDRIFSLTKARLEAEAAAAAAAAAAASASDGAGGTATAAAVAAASSAWDKIRPADVDVYVMAFGGGKGFTGLLPERMHTARRLWQAGVTAEFAYRVRPKLPAQFRAAEAARVPFAVILGEDELARGQVRIKELGLPPGAPDKDGVLVPLAELVPQLKRRLRRKKQQELGLEQSQGHDGGEAGAETEGDEGDDGGSALAARVESVIFEG
jgi:histidyl-tRNA synthetase